MPIRYNNIRDVIANLLKELCRDFRTELKLQPLTGERFEESTDLDIWVFNTSANRYANQKVSANPMKSTKRRRHL